jgi:hypothetical protein
MGLFANLLSAKPKADTPEGEFEAIVSSLERVRAERATAKETIAAVAAKRAAMIETDAADEAILALEVDAARARIAIDKADLAEKILLERLSALENSELEKDLRQLYAVRHEAAAEFAEAYFDCINRLATLRHLNSALAANPLSRAYGVQPEPAPVILTADTLERWLAGEEALHAAETARQARNPIKETAND